MEVRQPEEPIVWGIKMGLQPKNDTVTRMLEDEMWEDDATATTAVSTAEPEAMEDELSDEESAGEPMDEENLYREPPSDPLYNGQGMSRREEI